MEKIKENLLQVNFLLTICVIKISKENVDVSLFHNSIQNNYVHKANNEKAVGRLMLFQASKPVV